MPTDMHCAYEAGPLTDGAHGAHAGRETSSYADFLIRALPGGQQVAVLRPLEPSSDTGAEASECVFDEPSLAIRVADLRRRGLDADVSAAALAALRRAIAAAAPVPPPAGSDEAARLRAIASCDPLRGAADARLDDLVRFAASVTGMPLSALSLVDRRHVHFIARSGFDIPAVPRDRAFCTYAILARDVPMVVPDSHADARFDCGTPMEGMLRVRSYAGVPLTTPDGHALGTLCVMDHLPRQLPPEALEALSVLARAAAGLLELRRTEARIQRMALADELTGLPNRRALLGELDRSIARQQRDGIPFSLLQLELDCVGPDVALSCHEARGEILDTVASMLVTCLRGQDLAARLDSNSFAALLVGGDGAEASIVGERLVATVQAGMRRCGHDVIARVGAACFMAPPEDADEALGVVRQLVEAARHEGRRSALAIDYRPQDGVPGGADGAPT